MKLQSAVWMLLKVASVYPLAVLGFTWSKVALTDLEGGRNGPRDAYRHSLSSALVAYTLGEWAVRAVTTVMESRGTPSNLMDVHNNRVGMKLGASARSLWEIEPLIQNAVRNGSEHSTDQSQITWLAREKWGRNWAW
jgi:hypothetical protein